MTRVPLSEPLSKIRQEPCARCRFLSDGFPARISGSRKRLKLSMRSAGTVASNIAFTQLVLNESESPQTLRAVVGDLHARDLDRFGTGRRLRRTTGSGARQR